MAYCKLLMRVFMVFLSTNVAFYYHSILSAWLNCVQAWNIVSYLEMTLNAALRLSLIWSVVFANHPSQLLKYIEIWGPKRFVGSVKAHKTKLFIFPLWSGSTSRWQSRKKGRPRFICRNWRQFINSHFLSLNLLIQHCLELRFAR